MSYLLAIDPGVHENYVARFADGVLFSVLDWPTGALIRSTYDVCIFERPQFDGRVHKHVIDLAVNAALLAGSTRAPLIRGVEPREWKGSQRKPVHHLRIWRALSPAERKVLPDDTHDRITKAILKGAKDAWRKPSVTYYGKAKGSEIHNVVDAVGLGLFQLGRLVP